MRAGYGIPRFRRERERMGNHTTRCADDKLAVVRLQVIGYAGGHRESRSGRVSEDPLEFDHDAD